MHKILSFKWFEFVVLHLLFPRLLAWVITVGPHDPDVVG